MFSRKTFFSGPMNFSSGPFGSPWGGDLHLRVEAIRAEHVEENSNRPWHDLILIWA
jgi:hypothetical protein